MLRWSINFVRHPVAPKDRLFYIICFRFAPDVFKKTTDAPMAWILK